MLLRSLLPSLLILLGSVFPAAAAAPKSPADVLDQKRIHYEYNEGSFEKVTQALEYFMARNKTYSLEDSIFIAKHLAVVYSANPQTREKGKYYMYRLLALLPSAKLVDMYVSDEIDRIFDKVREEYMARQRSFGADTSRMALPERRPAQPTQPAPAEATPSVRADKGRSGTAFWIGGGVALAAAGAAFYYLSQEPEPDNRVLVIRDRNSP
jgi:hypothetical protein